MTLLDRESEEWLNILGGAGPGKGPGHCPT